MPIFLNKKSVTLTKLKFLNLEQVFCFWSARICVRDFFEEGNGQFGDISEIFLLLFLIAKCRCSKKGERFDKAYLYNFLRFRRWGKEHMPDAFLGEDRQFANFFFLAKYCSFHRT